MARRYFVAIINECPFLNRSLESIEQISTAFRPFVFMTVLRSNQKHFEMDMRNLTLAYSKLFWNIERNGQTWHLVEAKDFTSNFLPRNPKMTRLQRPFLHSANFPFEFQGN